MVSVINNVLDDIEKTLLNTAVIGEMGIGKSSLINALWEVKADEEGAAVPLGRYVQPVREHHTLLQSFPSITLWVLPGIGSFAFQPHDYLKKIKFEDYDFFIIVSSGLLKLDDTELAKAIMQMNRTFYFVRTHTDTDLKLEKQFKPTIFNKKNTLKKIRNKVSRILKEVTHQEPPVFLVSNLDVSDLDFPKLDNTFLRELPVYKHHRVMITLPSVTDATIEQKRDMLKQKILKESRMPYHSGD